MSRAVTLVRASLGFAAVTIAALAFDVWLRFLLLPLVRKDELRIPLLNRTIRAWATILFGSARWALRLEVAVDGKLPSGARYLIVSNHQSSLDIPLLISTFRDLDLKFVAMDELAHGKPAISLAIRHGGFVTVGKKSVSKDLAALRKFSEELPRFHGSPVIFPAGVLDRGHGRPRFYFGGIEAVRRGSRLPILPVTLSGLAAAPTIGGYLRLARARVTVRVMDPIPCEAFDDDPRGSYARLEEEIYGRLTAESGLAGPAPVTPATPGTSARTDGA